MTAIERATAEIANFAIDLSNSRIDRARAHLHTPNNERLDVVSLKTITEETNNLNRLMDK